MNYVIETLILYVSITFELENSLVGLVVMYHYVFYWCPYKQPLSFNNLHKTTIFLQVTTTVGYQDKLESQVAPMSILTFCLNEILLRTLMGNDSILSCLTHIIVDGVDENDRFCDLLLLVLSEALTRYKMLKLILLSNSESPKAFK